MLFIAVDNGSLLEYCCSDKFVGREKRGEMRIAMGEGVVINWDIVELSWRKFYMVILSSFARQVIGLVIIMRYEVNVLFGFLFIST